MVPTCDDYDPCILQMLFVTFSGVALSLGTTRCELAYVIGSFEHFSQELKGRLCRPIRSRQTLQIRPDKPRPSKITNFASTQYRRDRHRWSAMWRCLTSRAVLVPRRL